MRQTISRTIRPHRSGLFVWLVGACCCLLFPLIAGAQQNLSDEALDKRLDEIIEVMADDPGKAWSELEAIREACKDAADRELWADWNIVAGFAQQALGNLDTAEQFVEESITLYRANNSEEGVLSALLVRGELFIAMGRYREGIQDLEEVLTSSVGMKTEEPEDVEYYAAAAHQSLGEAYTILGDFAAALEHIQATYRIYEGLEDEMGLSVTVGMLGNLYVDLDAAEKALEMYREGVRVDRQRGDEINVAINLYNIGRALTDLGKHDEARQHYAESLEISNRIGNRSTIGYIYYGAGLSFAAEDRDEDATESFEQAVESLQEMQDDYMMSKAQLQLALIQSRAGRFEDSNLLLESVLTVMQQGDAKKDLVKVHDLFADNYASQGKFQLAYEHASTRSDLMSTLASEERARRTAHLRVQFDSERAESVNRELSEENRLKAQMLDKEQDFNRLTLIGVLILLLIAVALSYSIWRQKQLEKSLVLLANTDDLTGLVNRRRLFEIGNHEMHRAVRYGHEMTVLVLDLDYFKKINDQYGHAVGDLVLRRVAAHIAGGLREEDWLGRFGGEEFIAILPHTDRPHATEVAERIRVDVANLDYKACSVESRLTVSIGVSWLHGRGDSFQMMVNRADAALYNAKAAGRNRVVLQEESGETQETT